MIRFHQVSKSFGGVVALRPTDLHLLPQKTTMLIGPSGCGKSTLLRLSSGLIEPTTGWIEVAGTRLNRSTLSGIRRRMGYVIQSGDLFPHLTAGQNVRIVAQELKLPATEMEARVEELCVLTRFSHSLLDRYPAELSGGEQRRVSLIRALMMRPAMLLLDEPLGALDPMVRAGLLLDLKLLFERLNTTVIMVTHNLTEAARLGDWIILLKAGRIVQQGTFSELSLCPAEPFVSDFLRTSRGGAHVKIRALFLILAALVLERGAAADPTVAIGSKKFTESFVLAELAKRTLEDSGFRVEHRQGMGGTIVLWQALRQGSIAAYPDYTGTIQREILKQPGALSIAAMREQLANRGIGVTGDLGFNNTYALVMTRSRAGELGIKNISDLANHADLRLGLTHEFLSRDDGWGPLQTRYGLNMASVRGIDHTIGYLALQHAEIDVKDAYSTDARIEEDNLLALHDDLNFFPEYKAVFLFRLDAPPRAIKALRRLEGTLDEARMIRMNTIAEHTKSYASAAAWYFEQQGQAHQASRAETLGHRLMRWTSRHLMLVGLSLGASIGVGVPLGIYASRSGWIGELIIGITGLIQTIPSLALLALLVAIPFLGIRPVTAVIALFLYGLLPIVRNTATGLRDIAPQIREAAEVLGLKPRTRLLKIFLPLASPAILGGIKTSAIINIGSATLAALIGAGGLGEPIISGLNLNDKTTILEGAIPAALMAIAAQGLFAILDRFIILEDFV